MQHSRNIVVVEDDASMRQAIERILRAAGFEPTLFASAEALLESDATADAGCMVLDVHLPGLSGFQLRELLSKAGTRLPVIFITAHDEPAARDQAKSAGAVAFLAKPFSGRMLLEKVEQALRLSRAAPNLK
jgi:FixJ family two-component response regulator